jgi:hypothetical protein
MDSNEIERSVRDMTEDLRFEFDRAVDTMIHEKLASLSALDKHLVLTECGKFFGPAAANIVTLIVDRAGSL